MYVGYARVSSASQEQSLHTQREQLIDAGCDDNRIYTDTISGTKWQRPGLDAALHYMRSTDILVETVTTISDLATGALMSRSWS